MNISGRGKMSSDYDELQNDDSTMNSIRTKCYSEFQKYFNFQRRIISRDSEEILPWMY